MGTFPYGAVWCEPSNPEANCGNSRCNCNHGVGTFFGLGWDGLILLYMEYEELYKQFDDSVSPYQILSGINLVVRKNRIAMYDCPSDPQDRVKSNNNWWASNDGGVAHTESAWQASSTLGQHPIMHGNGMLLNVLAKKVRDVYDGTSNTLFVGEDTGGEVGSNENEAWTAYYGIVFSTAFGTNGLGTIPSEGVRHWPLKLAFPVIIPAVPISCVPTAACTSNRKILTKRFSSLRKDFCCNQHWFLLLCKQSLRCFHCLSTCAHQGGK